MNELELRYGDCTVKRLSGGTLNAAMKNLKKFGYAGTPLGQIRVTGQFGCPFGTIEQTSDRVLWHFCPQGIEPFPPRIKASELMTDIKNFWHSQGHEDEPESVEQY